MLDMLAPEDTQNLTLKDFIKPNKIQLSGIILYIKLLVNYYLYIYIYIYIQELSLMCYSIYINS